MFLTCFSLATLLVVLALCVETGRGMVVLQRLERIEPDPNLPLPKISIVVAARDEEKNIRAGVTSLIDLDYLNKEVIVVNDRSTDKTADILAAMSRERSMLRVVTVTELPFGWLGKNYALSQGAQSADGDYLLFTDADVVMEKSVLRRALRYAQDNNLDHLAIGPAALMPGIWLNMFMVGFTIFFNLFTRPWKVRDPKSKAHVGIGAFNLVRRAAYQAVGGHAPIALRPDDDLKLGKLMKKNGYRSDFLVGAPLISVEWYSSVGELVHGLEKNMFAGCDYKMSLVLIGAVAQIWIFQWPVAALFLCSGWTRWIYAFILFLLLWIGVNAARAQRLSRWYAFGLPLASMMFVFLMLRTTFLNLRDRGIYWRGTFYPLAALRNNRV